MNLQLLISYLPAAHNVPVRAAFFAGLGRVLSVMVCLSNGDSEMQVSKSWTYNILLKLVSPSSTSLLA